MVDVLAVIRQIVIGWIAIIIQMAMVEAVIVMVFANVSLWIDLIKPIFIFPNIIVKMRRSKFLRCR